MSVGGCVYAPRPMITILRLDKPTPKGSIPLTALVEGHGLIRGFASSTAKVAAGDVLGPEVIAHSRDTGFWVWVA